MKKILHLLWRFDKGGIEAFIINLLRHKKYKGFKFNFVVCGPVYNQLQENEVIKFGCKIYHLPLIKDKESKLQFLAQLETILNLEQYDGIHSHMSYLNIPILRIAKQKGIKSRISHVHDAGATGIKAHLKQFLISKYATELVACSFKSGIKYYGKWNKKFRVIYCGVDINKFLSEKSHNQKNFIICGRICKEKNPDFIIKLIKELIKIDPDYKFLWIGSGCLDDIPKARDLPINNFKFLGPQEDVIPFLKSSSYMLMPSISEGIATSSLEAQTAGLFVFASDNITEETNLGLISYWDLSKGEKYWAKRIDSFIKDNKIESKHLDKNRLKEFDTDYCGSKIFSLY